VRVPAALSDSCFAGPTGDWENDKRHGFGICKFADGTRFKGEWDADAWVQSLADPKNSKVSGQGISRALAGFPATFDIKVLHVFSAMHICSSCHV
jgi:hypothetical protein